MEHKPEVKPSRRGKGGLAPRQGLDELDHRIIREVRVARSQDADWSYATVARAVFSTPNTVRLRIIRLKKLGILEESKSDRERGPGVRGRSGLDDIDLKIIEIYEKTDGLTNSGRIARELGIEKPYIIANRIRRLRKLGQLTVPTRIRNQHAGKTYLLSGEKLSWVEKFVKRARDVARGVAGRTGDLDAIESDVLNELVRVAQRHHGDFASFEKFIVKSLFRTARRSRAKAKLDRLASRRESLRDAIWHQPADELAYDDEYNHIVELLTPDQKVILDHAVENEKPITSAAFDLGLSLHQSRVEAEWIRMKLAGYGGAKP